MQRFPEVVRKRLTLQSLLSVIPALAVLWYLDGGDVESLFFVLVGITLAGVLRAVIDAYDVDRRIFKLLFGLVVFGGGIVSAQNGTWPAIAFLVGGGWLVLDTVDDYRHGVERRRESTKTDVDRHEMQALSRIAQLILAELREYAKTRDQLHVAVDEDNEKIDEALDRFQRSGIVEERGGAYYVNENRLGYSAFVRKIFQKVGSRIARPFTIAA